MLLIGFSISAVTNVNIDDYHTRPWAANTFYITAFLTVFFSLHVVISSTWINIWAIGIALRGTSFNSMDKAISKMLAERSHIVYSFILSLVLFTLMATAACWIIMEDTPAIVLSTIAVIFVFLEVKMNKTIFRHFRENDYDDRATDSTNDPTGDRKGDSPLSYNSPYQRTDIAGWISRYLCCLWLEEGCCGQKKKKDDDYDNHSSFYAQFRDVEEGLASTTTTTAMNPPFLQEGRPGDLYGDRYSSSLPQDASILSQRTNSNHFYNNMPFSSQHRIMFGTQRWLSRKLRYARTKGER